MGRGGGNGRRRISTQCRGNTSTAQGSTSTISPDHEPASSRLEFGLGNVSSNAAADDEYTSESSQRVVLRSKTTQQNGSNTTQSAGSLHKTFLIPLATLFNDQNVPTVIRGILEGMFEGAWTTWTEVPQENRDLMWVQFQLRYQWDPKDEVQVKANWNGILAVRFRDVIRDARDKAIKLAGENGVIVRDDWSVLKKIKDWMCKYKGWSTDIEERRVEGLKGKY